MVWIHAASVPAKMVYHKPFNQRPARQLPSEAMHKVILVVIPDLPVALVRFPVCPKPTLAQFREIDRQGAILVHFGPKALFQFLIYPAVPPFFLSAFGFGF